MLDKSVQSRTCKIAGRVHSKNNTYLWYYQKKRALYQKCFSPSCIGKNPVFIYRVKEAKAAVKIYDLPSPDDASLAAYFIKWKPLIAVERIDKKYIWFVYDEKVGYWKTSEQARLMQMMMLNFREYVKDKFDAAIEKADGGEDELIRNAEAVDMMLRTVRVLKGLAESVRWQLAKDYKIEWN